MCVLPNAPTALIDKHMLTKVYKGSLSSKVLEFGSHVETVNTPSSFLYIVEFSTTSQMLCQQDIIRKFSKTIFEYTLGKKK